MLGGKGLATKCLVITVFLMVLIQAGFCRRSGSRSIPSSGRQRTSTYRKPTTYNQPKTHYPKSTVKKSKPKSFFNKGGISKFAKIALAAYVAKKMVPSIGFRPFGGYDRRRRASYCRECMSINGSDLACERGFSSEMSSISSRCYPSTFKPYCSIEHGRTIDDVKYVRRGCSQRTCDSCTSELMKLTQNVTKKCYVFQCDMCNWNNCNNKGASVVFRDNWSGCVKSSGLNSSTFADDETCAARAIQGNMFAVSILSLALLCLKLR